MLLNATPFLKFYASRRMKALASMDFISVQQQQLKYLLRRAQKTEFGRAHDFASIKSVEEYQRAVPVRSYDDFWNLYFKKHFPRINNITWPGLYTMYAVSSGTSTGATKYLPLTKEMNRSNKKAGLDLLAYHIHNFPGSRIFGGKNFFLGGSTDLVEESPGVLSGDLSGIVAKYLPFWAKPWYFPPKELALLKNWEEKIEAFATKAPLDDIRLLSGVPSWLLIYFENLKRIFPEKGTKIKDFFPNLEVLVHGGVNFAPYQRQFSELLEGSRTQLREVYPASEGFIAIADRGPGEGMRMCLDHGIFYEFVPVDELESSNPTRHWVGNIQKDVNYAVIMTTCAGLWSYRIGDTVRFVDLNPPRLLVTGRTSYMMSAFGEHLIGEEIENAVSTAADSIGKSVTDYSVGAVFPKDIHDIGGHLFVIEFADGIPSDVELVEFKKRLDRELCVNDDFKAHRAEGYGLKAPEVRAVKPGTFAAWMKSRGKLGGQHKVPRIINDQGLFENLQGFVAGAGA